MGVYSEINLQITGQDVETVEVALIEYERFLRRTYESMPALPDALSWGSSRTSMYLKAAEQVAEIIKRIDELKNGQC